MRVYRTQWTSKNHQSTIIIYVLRDFVNWHFTLFYKLLDPQHFHVPGLKLPVFSLSVDLKTYLGIVFWWCLDVHYVLCTVKYGYQCRYWGICIRKPLFKFSWNPALSIQADVTSHFLSCIYQHCIVTSKFSWLDY